MAGIESLQKLSLEGVMSDKYRNVNNNRRDGFGFNLYRNTEKGKIGGVCAGLADHFGINANIMRLIFIAGLIFINSIAFLRTLFFGSFCPRGNQVSQNMIMNTMKKSDVIEKSKCFAIVNPRKIVCSLLMSV